MKYCIVSLFYIQIIIAIAESFVIAPISTRSTTSTTTSLQAYSHAGWGTRSSGASIPSRTACESAVNVEWEPMSELERRIEDGIHYEHMPNRYDSQYHHQEGNRMPGCHSKARRIEDKEDNDDSQSVRAVFCAYRYSADDYNRLKSADIS